MKKLSSLFLGSLMLFTSTGLGSVFAGGIDKEETLSDGTKLIYISTENIPRKMDEYLKEYRNLFNQKYSKKQSLAIKGTSIAAAVGACCLLSKVQGQNLPLSIFGQAASCALGVLSFLLPDWHNNKFSERLDHLELSWIGLNRWNYHLFSKTATPEEKEAFFRDYEKRYGKKSYYEEFHTGLERNSEEEDNSGIVIVLRPKEKSKIKDAMRSYVYSQWDFDVYNSGAEHKALIRCVEIGW